MKVSITSGSAEGPTKLNAFDNALLKAGIGDLNLIKVSSIIPSGSELVELPPLNPGKMINTVLSYVTSDQRGDQLCAAIAVAVADEMGCVVEHSGINRESQKIKKESEDMARYMMRVRGLEIKDLIIKYQEHQVKELGAAVSALVYL